MTVCLLKGVHGVASWPSVCRPPPTLRSPWPPCPLSACQCPIEEKIVIIRFGFFQKRAERRNEKIGRNQVDAVGEFEA